jgi:hypothetical protein
MVPNPNFCAMMIFLPIAYYGLICFFLKYSKSKFKTQKKCAMNSMNYNIITNFPFDDQVDEKFSFYVYILHTCFKCMTFVCEKLQTYKKWTSHNFLHQNHCMKFLMKSWKYCSKLQCLPNLLFNLVFILFLFLKS